MVSQLAPAVDETKTTIVVIQNGVGNEEPFRLRFPGCTIITCVVSLLLSGYPPLLIRIDMGRSNTDQFWSREAQQIRRHANRTVPQYFSRPRPREIPTRYLRLSSARWKDKVPDLRRYPATAMGESRLERGMEFAHHVNHAGYTVVAQFFSRCQPVGTKTDAGGHRCGTTMWGIFGT